MGRQWDGVEENGELVQWLAVVLGSWGGDMLWMIWCWWHRHARSVSSLWVDVMLRRETKKKSSDDAFVCFGLQDLQGCHGGSERAENIVGQG